MNPSLANQRHFLRCRQLEHVRSLLSDNTNSFQVKERIISDAIGHTHGSTNCKVLEPAAYNGNWPFTPVVDWCCLNPPTCLHSRKDNANDASGSDNSPWCTERVAAPLVATHRLQMRIISNTYQICFLPDTSEIKAWRHTRISLGGRTHHLLRNPVPIRDNRNFASPKLIGSKSQYLIQTLS